MDNTADQAGLLSARSTTNIERAIRFRQSFWPAIIMAACLSLLAIAAGLEPSSSGTGTHTQLGLPGCSVLVTTGLPCATCGMTTAFAYAADGQLISAIITQPAGAIMAISVAACSIVCCYALIFNIPLTPLAARLWRVQTIFAIAIVVLGSWLYKAMVLQGLI